MARTIDSIKTELKEAFMQDATLQSKYGFNPGEEFDNVFSKVSIESMLLFIIATSIWTLEKLFDTHTKEVTEYIATMKPHSLRWYVEKAKAFLYGIPLIDGTDKYPDTLTDQEIETAKIITFAACTEDNATLYLKVAKAGPSPLTNSEKTALESYLHEIKDAGVRVDITSQEGDYLEINMKVYYNPLLINACGESKRTGEKVVETAIRNYIENIPFNGEFRKNELVDAIQKVEGVEMIEPGAFYHAETASGTMDEIIAYCRPVSGYFKFSIADISGITYIAYA